MYHHDHDWPRTKPQSEPCVCEKTICHLVVLRFGVSVATQMRFIDRAPRCITRGDQIHSFAFRFSRPSPSLHLLVFCSSIVLLLLLSGFRPQKTGVCVPRCCPRDNVVALKVTLAVANAIILCPPREHSRDAPLKSAAASLSTRGTHSCADKNKIKT